VTSASLRIPVINTTSESAADTYAMVIGNIVGTKP